MTNEQPPLDMLSLVEPMLLGELDDARAEALERWLAADEVNRVAFLHEVQLCRGIRRSLLAEASGEALEDAWDESHEPKDARPDVMAELVEQALASRRRRELEDEANRQLVAQQAEEARERRYRLHQPEPESGPRTVVIPKAVVWLGLAAALGLAVWVGMELNRPATTQTDRTAEQSPAMPNPQTAPAPLPAPPARVALSRDARWAGERFPGSGGALSVGAYELASGHVQVVMGDGATLIVAGPASFSVDSASAVSLSGGALSAYVPEGAEGFWVDTPAGRVVDLGTAFGVEVTGEDTAEVHVAEGLVEASLGGDGAPQALEAGEAARLDRVSAAIEPVVVHTEKFARDWGQVERSIRVEGAARYLYDTPGSLRQGAVESNELFFVLPERRGVVLADGLVSDFVGPGVYDHMPRSAVGLPEVAAGTAVDCFLLHYDRVGSPTELVAVEGVIRFDRPVVGILVDDRRLAATDVLFRNNQAQYPPSTDQARGLEGREHESNLNRLQDVVTLSADRMTLTVKLETSTGIDQLRVLVEAGPAGAGDN